MASKVKPFIPKLPVPASPMDAYTAGYLQTVASDPAKARKLLTKALEAKHAHSQPTGR